MPSVTGQANSIMAPRFTARVGLGALLLLVAAAFFCTADKVTTRICKPHGQWVRVRKQPTDTEATILLADRCQLTDLDATDFAGLPSVSSIDLEQNEIEHLDTTVFRNFSRLTWLDFNGNKLKELPVFDQLSCQSMKILDFKSNFITEISNNETFSACTRLEKLYLSKNRIEYLHPDLFSSLSSLRMLRLNNNKISYIPDSLLKNDKLEWLEVQENRLSHLPGDIVSSHKSLQHIEFQDNPWHCPCLLELLSDVSHVKIDGVFTYQGAELINYVSWLYNGRQPMCVFNGKFSCHRHVPSGLLRPPPQVTTKGTARLVRLG